MKTRIFLLVMVLAIAMSALVVAQTNSGDDNGDNGTPLPQQPAQVGQSDILNESAEGGVTGGERIVAQANESETATISGTTGAAAGDISRFFNGDATTTVSSGDRDVITRRANDAFGDYSTSDFVMSRADFDDAVSQRSEDIYIIDVGAAGNRNIANANMIGLRDLSDRLTDIPVGRTVAVFADNDIDGAVAVTILRLQGYNAWFVENGTATTGTTGFAGTTGTTRTDETDGATRESDSPLPPQ